METKASTKAQVETQVATTEAAPKSSTASETSKPVSKPVTEKLEEVISAAGLNMVETKSVPAAETPAAEPVKLGRPRKSATVIEKSELVQIETGTSEATAEKKPV